jgi:hypothetical protein
MSSLEFDSAYWEQHLSDGMQKSDLQTKLHLIFSLLIFLTVSVRQLLQFIFSSDIKEVKNRASRFMGHTPTAMDEDLWFPPSTLFNLWHVRWPHVQHLLHNMIQPCAHEIVLEESDNIIKDPSLQIRIKTLTIKEICDLLHPDALLERFKKSAPFMFGLLHTFSASPNKYRKQKAAQHGSSREAIKDEDWEDDPNAEDNASDDEQPSGDSWKEYDGFRPRSATLVSNRSNLKPSQFETEGTRN